MNSKLKFNLTRRERLKSALYLRLKKRKTFFLEKNLKFSKKNSFGKCRTVPKNVKGGPFFIHKRAFCSKITKKLKGGTLWGHLKISKSRTVPKKNRKNPLVPSGLVGNV